MKRLSIDLVGSLFWFLIGGAFLIGGIMEGLGTLRRPGPGFLPTVIAGFVLLLGVVLLKNSLLREGVALPRIAWKKHLVVILSIVGYTLVIGLIGFSLATFALMFILYGMLFVGKYRWLISIAAAAITAFAAWLVFVVGCQVPFPTPLIFKG